MKFDPVARRSLPDAVFDQLLEQICRGELQVGTRLPSERQLCEQLGVNRGSMREALKRLSQAGLLTVRHGGGNQVRDYKREGGLDLLPHLLFRGNRVEPEVAHSVLEMRSALAPEIAACCAERSGVHVHQRLNHLLGKLAAAGDDLDARQRLSLELWDAIAEGAGNIAYRLAFNTLRETYAHVRVLLAHALSPELCADNLYRDLVRGIEAGEVETARRAAAKMMKLGSDGVFELLKLLRDGFVPPLRSPEGE